MTRVNPDDREDTEAAPGEGQPMPSPEDDATTAQAMVGVLGPPLAAAAARIGELLRDQADDHTVATSSRPTTEYGAPWLPITSTTPGDNGAPATDRQRADWPNKTIANFNDDELATAIERHQDDPDPVTRQIVRGCVREWERRHGLAGD